MRKNIIQAQKEVEDFYVNNKGEFIAKFRKLYPEVSQDVIIEIFQESVVIGVEKLQQSKFEGKSTFKTYVFGIGKNLVREYFRLEKKKTEYVKQSVVFTDESESMLIFDETSNLQQSLMKKALSKLEKKCLEIITAFYLEEKKYTEIVKEFNYSSVDVAKSTKSRCFKHLKMLISNETAI